MASDNGNVGHAPEAHGKETHGKAKFGIGQRVALQHDANGHDKAIALGRGRERERDRDRGLSITD